MSKSCLRKTGASEGKFSQSWLLKNVDQWFNIINHLTEDVQATHQGVFKKGDRAFMCYFKCLGVMIKTVSNIHFLN